jgi:uncharacterized membrane protein YphA (DoxX/SURF4 family)
MTTQNLAIAELMVRVIAGILFFFQGYDKLFNIKMEEVVNTFMKDAERRHIPKPMIAFISYLTSLVELIGGFLLILGLFTNMAATALCLDLIVISLAFSMMQPMWDLKHVFPRLILLFLLLALPQNCHFFSLDFLLNR